MENKILILIFNEQIIENKVTTINWKKKKNLNIS